MPGSIRTLSDTLFRKRSYKQRDRKIDERPDMPHIRFSIQVDMEDQEPSRVVRRIEGRVYQYAGGSDVEEQVGTLYCFLIQPGLAEEGDPRHR